jgi:plasmid stabilization system protein ParE
LARLIYSRKALDDLTRLKEFLKSSEPASAPATVHLILDALQILERHPLVGRPVEDGLMELVISRGRTGYIALYSLEEAADCVLVLAVRHQREAGFLEPGL